MRLYESEKKVEWLISESYRRRWCFWEKHLFNQKWDWIFWKPCVGSKAIWNVRKIPVLTHQLLEIKFAFELLFVDVTRIIFRVFSPFFSFLEDLQKIRNPGNPSSGKSQKSSQNVRKIASLAPGEIMKVLHLSWVTPSASFECTKNSLVGHSKN